MIELSISIVCYRPQAAFFSYPLTDLWVLPRKNSLCANELRRQEIIERE
jgi:hypothetical protein